MIINWLIFGWLFLFTTIINIHDFKSRVIKNWWILILMVLGTIFMANNWQDGGMLGIIVFFSFLLLLILLFMVSSENSIGGGDIKFIVASSLFLNYVNVMPYAFYFLGVGIVFYITHKFILRKRKNKEYEFKNLETKKVEKISIAGAPTISLPLIMSILFFIYEKISAYQIYLITFGYIVFNILLIVILKKMKLFSFYKEVNENEEIVKENI